jgi:hypothetical protein
LASGIITSKMTGSYGVRIEWNSTSDVETNTSTFTMRTYVLHPYMNVTNRTGSVMIDGSTYSFHVPPRNSSDSPWLVNTRTVPIKHGDDGTKRISVSAAYPFNVNSSAHGYIGTIKASGECVLDNIPRASDVSSQTAQVTVNGVNEWVLIVSKHSGAFRHRAVLTFGANRHETEPFDTTTSYAVPVSWLNAIPTQKQSTVTVAIQTYSDETCTTAIGDPVYTSFDILVPDTAAPEIAAGWASVAPYNAGSAAEGMSVYVQGFSRAEVTFDETKLSARYGASIASVAVAVGSNRTTEAPYRTAKLTKSGMQTIRCIATDTRGFTSSVTLEVNVEAYAPPSLSDIQIYRCNADGVEDDTGAYLFFMATCSYSDCGGENTATVNALYKPVSNGLWTNAAEIISGVGSILGGGALSPTISYSARITATDRLGKGASFTTTISTAEVAFNLKKGGKGGAFGKYAEEDGLLNCVWRFRAEGGVEGVNVYTTAEEETGGAWTNGAKIYRSVVVGSVSSTTDFSKVGEVSPIQQLISVSGQVRTSSYWRELTEFRITTAGAVYAKPPVTGQVTMILYYTKSEEG